MPDTTIYDSSLNYSKIENKNMHRRFSHFEQSKFSLNIGIAYTSPLKLRVLIIHCD